MSPTDCAPRAASSDASLFDAQKRSSVDSTTPVVSPLGLNPGGGKRDYDDEDTEADVDDDDTVDAASIASTASWPDWRGYRGYSVTDEHTKVVYEAYEIIKNNNTEEWDTWKSICGLHLGNTWRSLRDGYVGLRAEVAFEQGELSDLYADAVRKFVEGDEGKKEKKKSKKQQQQHGGKDDDNDNDNDMYAQDLADRVYHLPCTVYNHLVDLVNDKAWATDRNPFRKREWRIAVLEEGEFQLTERLPRRNKKKSKIRSIFFFWKRQQEEKEEPHFRKWFVVLEGRETKTSKHGWLNHGPRSNPWWKVDRRETRGRRQENKAMREYFGRKNAQQQQGGNSAVVNSLLHPPPPPPRSNSNGW